jgi:D-sedoheptulose 7-phosphate isomerase
MPIRESIGRHLASLGRIQESAQSIERAVEMMRSALSRGAKVLTCGNGGSAAEALHLAEEMMGRFSKDRPPYSAVCLCSDATALTCISNDFGYEQVFARQVIGLGKPGDVLVVLSTSGKSPNILRALEAAKTAHVQTIGLLGVPGSPAERLCDLPITFNAPEGAHVQEMHLLTIHLILEQLDAIESK